MQLTPQQIDWLLFLGVAIDSSDLKDVTVIKKKGQVKLLEDEINNRK